MKTVRNGQKVWPYCEECGCRLQIIGNLVQHWLGDITVIDANKHHFEVESDARGCKCSKLVDFWFID